MFLISSAVVSELMMVPVLMMLFRFTLRSKMIRAPVREADISLHASTVWAMAISIAVLEAAFPEWKLLPIRSKMRLSSGWKRMSRAIRPSSTALRSRLLIMVSLKTSDSQSTTSRISRPWAR